MKLKLEQLLSDVDNATAAPCALSNIAIRAAKIGRRRRNVRRGGSAIVLLAVAAGLFSYLTRGPEKQSASPVGIAGPTTVLPAPMDAPNARAGIEQFTQDAEFHSQMAESLWALERSSLPSGARRRSRANEMERHPDDAAYALVYQADRLISTPGEIAAAAELYRQVAINFPESPSAPAARKRLAILERRKDG